MRWNALALECQLFLDVDCSTFTYSSPVHPQVASAATQLWHKQHGWADEEDKKRKILALPRWFSNFDKLCCSFSHSLFYGQHMGHFPQDGENEQNLSDFFF